MMHLRYSLTESVAIMKMMAYTCLVRVCDAHEPPLRVVRDEQKDERAVTLDQHWSCSIIFWRLAT